ncbi:hypothetical protein K402DRAFT_387951 [Aulographum hederae CBS 113979]|uniref:PH domain-containing protein n=1 Tax=Aulographum hederae CBS 113979 TaxID=1176131 RepID=A0A6G1HGI9_9PEZI|nr:hypothetical protein K402DRAFT_387951 [Aulographum hederae CBS 113979]
MAKPTPRRPSQLLDADVASLDPDSYTAHRLSHANPEHLYLTTRRCFVGPMPEGWLKSHRKEWYKHQLHLNYSSRAATFSAGDNVSRHRKLSGLDAPNRPTKIQQSFPQPRDIPIDEEGEGEDEAVATTEVPPAVSVPRASNPNYEVRQEGSRAERREAEVTGEGAQPLSPGSSRRPENMSQNSNGHPKQRIPGITIDRVDTNESDAQSGMGSMKRVSQPMSLGESQYGGISSTVGEPVGEAASTSSLIERDQRLEQAPDKEPKSVGGTAQTIMSKLKGGSSSKTYDQGRSPSEADGTEESGTGIANGQHRKRSLVQFSVPEASTRADLLMKARMTQMQLRRSTSGLRRDKPKNGQLIKMEKMLVRVDSAQDAKLPDDYDENASQGVVTTTLEKWREFMVVCRKHDDGDAEFLLQMYKTRVIPAIESNQGKKTRAKYEIPLSRKHAKVNLFSALDKTLVVWTPARRGVLIYVLRPHSSANGAEWFTFLRNILGGARAPELQVNVPDLSISLRIANPFKQLEDVSAAANDAETIQKSLEEEQAAAYHIIKKCLEMLEKSPEYGNIIGAWARGEKIGLAWKRYDRLEWIHGINEQKMYGSLAMNKSHELELRPKQHYPTTTHTRKGKALIEPVPVEGFLIRLTSQKGVHQRFGRLFYKRLYFSTHDQYLVFSRPAKSHPPPPPELPTTAQASIPTAHQVADKIPIIYAVNPYPTTESKDEISWLARGSSISKEKANRHDVDAQDEAERKLNTLTDCDGYINMCNIVKVRNLHRGATAADEEINSGTSSDVDFDEDVSNTREDDGTTPAMDDDRTFELVLKNGLLIRLQAFDNMTKEEWKKRLRALIKYWRIRTRQDIDLYKAVRRQNLAALRIDEEAESVVGQFARKWEVTKSYASPELYHMCGISCCRAVHHSGPLFRKPRRHATFTRCNVILVPGQLLVFRDTMRTRSGKIVPHIHHDKVENVDLKDCYLYSGLLTENDLLYQNRTFDANMPGHTALPRIYMEDGWTGVDEDVMCTFVLWMNNSKGWLRSTGKDTFEEDEDEGKRAKLKRVAKLGVKGRSVVFKARSRAERDHWVLAIGMEIERLQSGEDVRITKED